MPVQYCIFYLIKIQGVKKHILYLDKHVLRHVSDNVSVYVT